jgi:transposase InsO family protein
MTMSSDDPLLLRDRWARLRFAVVGSLLVAPPKSGELKAALRALSEKTWTHPGTGQPVRFGYSTIEKWLSAARRTDDPVRALRERPRGTAGRIKSLTPAAIEALRTLYHSNTNWSAKLLADNLRVVMAEQEPDRPAPSYPTVRRYLKNRGLRRHPLPTRDTEGTRAARERIDTREIRSYELDAFGALYHADFHDGSRKVLTKSGELVTPQLFGCVDDHSRLICHVQWYRQEQTEDFVHGLSQVFQKRNLPRALMSDNGSAMKGAEFKEGLARLGIAHNPTLEYCAFMNGKAEVFWRQVEGRLMAMLQHEKPLTLELLNRATQAWVELDYNRKIHSEIAATPLNRYLTARNVTRECPASDALRAAFRIQITRKQRQSDGTVQLGSKRFEIPSRYRHVQKLTLRYARWDLTRVDLVDPNTDTILCPIFPLDKAANADAHRRTFESLERAPLAEAPSGVAPLMKKLLADYAATGLPPAFLPTDLDCDPDEAADSGTEK